jgi:AbiJ-like protein
MSFSERHGLKPIRQVLQTDSIDAALRNRLWNTLRERFPGISGGYKIDNPRNQYLRLSVFREGNHDLLPQLQHRRMLENVPWDAQAPARLCSHYPSLRRKRVGPKRSEENALARQEWKSSNEQSISDERKVKPALSKLSISAIATALSVSWSYAADIRRGRSRPHARHWAALARLVKNLARFSSSV